MMHCRRTFVVAIVVYVTLDLSLAAMPGAFVFEPADTVESAQNRNGRAGIQLAAPGPLLISSFVLPSPRFEAAAGGLSRRDAACRVPRLTVALLARATLAPAAEDPH